MGELLLGENIELCRGLLLLLVMLLQGYEVIMNIVVIGSCDHRIGAGSFLAAVVADNLNSLETVAHRLHNISPRLVRPKSSASKKRCGLLSSIVPGRRVGRGVRKELVVEHGDFGVKLGAHFLQGLELVLQNLHTVAFNKIKCEAKDFND